MVCSILSGFTASEEFFTFLLSTIARMGRSGGLFFGCVLLVCSGLGFFFSA